MTLRSRHGLSLESGAIAPVLETLPVDELPAGIPAPPDAMAPPQRDSNGRFLPGQGTRRLAARAGRAKAGHQRMVAKLGAVELPLESDLRPYREHARQWRDAVALDMAATVGGGVVGPMPHALLDSAAHALLWSRYLSDCAMSSGDSDLALKAGVHATTSSKLVREAWEYCAREAKHRVDDEGAALAAEQAAFQRALVVTSD